MQNKIFGIIMEPFKNKDHSAKYYDPQSSSSILNNIAPKPTPKITYDSILNSMNMYVENGVLRFAVDKQKLEGQLNINQVQTQVQTQNINQEKQQVKRVEIKNSPVEPAVKNSWIYNKYFKNYKGEQDIQQEEIQLTPEELREKKIRDYIEYVNARKRAAQVKSTKMLFSNNSVEQIHINTSQNNAQLNRLFRF